MTNLEKKESRPVKKASRRPSPRAVSLPLSAGQSAFFGVFDKSGLFGLIGLFGLLCLYGCSDGSDRSGEVQKETQAASAQATGAAGGSPGGSPGGSAEGQTAADGSASSPKHLNFGCYNYSDSLDPVTNVNSSWCGVRFGITENLFKFSDQVVPEPALCDRHEVSDDYLTWILHIREGVKFSNGRPLTATAVVESLERLYAMTDPERGGQGNSKPTGYLIYKSISADDEAGTVTIELESPTSNIPGILAYPYFAIIDASVSEQEIIGTGPYKVIGIDPSVSIQAAKNELYWNGEVPFDTVTIIFVDDSTTKSMALQSGDLDLVENITTASDLEKLSRDPRFAVSTAAGVRTGNAYMNHKGVLANEALRRAVIMAVDRRTMCEVTVAGMYTPGFSVLPSSLAYDYDKLNDPFPYDQNAAAALLDEAGLVDGDGDGWREIDGRNIDLNFIAYSSRNLNEFAEATALQLAEIGVKATVSIRDYDTALGLQNIGEFDMITSNALTVGAGDPQEFLGNWHSANSVNYGFYSSEEYDSLYERLQRALDEDERRELIFRLQQVLADDASNLVFGYYNSRMISDVEKVKGAKIATMDYYWLTADIAPAK
jgi:ABC-type transport system substrate-binding protein